MFWCTLRRTDDGDDVGKNLKIVGDDVHKDEMNKSSNKP